MDQTIFSTITETPRGRIQTVRNGERNASAILPLNVAEAIQDALILEASFATYATRLAQHNADGATGALLAHEAKIGLPAVRSAFHRAITSTSRRRGEVLAAHAASLQIFDANENAALRSDLRAWFMSHENAARIKIALDADYNTASAIYESGDKVAGLDGEVWELFEDHWRALNHIHRSNLANNFPVRSTLQFLSGAGLDKVALMARAKEIVAGHHADIGMVDDAEIYLKQVLAAICLIGNISPAEMLP